MEFLTWALVRISSFSCCDMKARWQWVGSGLRDLVMKCHTYWTLRMWMPGWMRDAPEDSGWTRIQEIIRICVFGSFSHYCKGKDSWHSLGLRNQHNDEGHQGPLLCMLWAKRVASVVSFGSLDWLLTPRLLCPHLPGDNVSNTGSCPRENDARYKRPSEVKVPCSPSKSVKLKHLTKI